MVVVALAALAAAWRWTPLADYVSARSVLQWARELRNVPWAPWALMLAYTPAAFILFPQPPMTLFAVLAFGPLIGMASVVCGKLLAALVTYSVGRFVKRQTLDRLTRGHSRDAKALAREHGVLATVAANFAPVPPFAIQSMIAGALRMPLWQYLLGTFLAAVPGVMAAGFFARELLQMMETDEGSGWMIALSVIVLIAVPLAVKRWVENYHARRRK
jgi:phospholipase D1/2